MKKTKKKTDVKAPPIHANRKFIRNAGVLVALCVVLGGGWLAKDKFKETEGIQGHPQNSITINGTEDPSKDYQLEKDSLELSELELKVKPQFKNYVQDIELASVFELDYDNIGRYNDTYRSLVPTSVKKVDDGYLIFSRFNHNDLSNIALGGLGVIKVDNSGKKLAEWYHSSKKVHIFRFMGGAVEADDGFVYSLFNNAEVLTPEHEYMLYGVDKHAVSQENQGDNAKIFELTGIRKAFDAQNDLRVISQTGNSLKVATSRFRSDNSQWIDFGTIDLDVNDFEQTTYSKVGRIENVILKDANGSDFANFPDTQTVVDVNAIEQLPNGEIAAFLNYQGNGNRGVSSLQIFTAEGKLKKVVPAIDYHYVNGSRYSEGEYIYTEGGNNTIYYFEKGRENSLLVSYNYVTDTRNIVQTYPKNTDLKFNSENWQYGLTYFGSTSSLSEAFSGFGESEVGEELIISGQMKNSSDSFKVSTLSFQKGGVTQAGSPSESMFTHVEKVEDDLYFVSGGTDSITLGNNVIQTEESPDYGKYTSSFYGLVGMDDDFSPAIVKTEEISIDIKAIKNNEEEKNKQLFNGYDGTKPIKVYDTKDVANPQYGQEWLNKRLNRNPLTYNALSQTYGPIDWQALGFEDNGKYGPNTVSYFIADSQMQTTTTSRIVNKIDDRVNHNDKLAFGVNNFAISVDEVANLTKLKVEQKAEALVWRLTSGEIISDGTTTNSDIKIDEGQLGEIKKAKAAYDNQKAVEGTSKFKGYADLLKPYPLDVKYETTEGGQVVKFSQRIWIFVTKENTTVANNVVLYADDFSMPLKNTAIASSSSLLKSPNYKLTEPNVRVYDFDSQPQALTDLVPLSVGANDGESKGLTTVSPSVNQVTTATTAKIINDFEYNYKGQNNKNTKVKIKLTIDDQPEITFNVERTKDESKLYDLGLDVTLEERMKELEIQLPKHMEIKDFATMTLPATWEKVTNSETADFKSFSFKMHHNNGLVTIEKFLKDIRFVAKTTIDEKGTIKIILVPEMVSSAVETAHTSKVPQKLKFQAYDTVTKPITEFESGGAPIYSYETVIDKELRIGKEYNLTAGDLKTIPNYKFWKFNNTANEDITGKFTVSDTLQTNRGVYQRTVFTLNARQIILNGNESVPLPAEGVSQLITYDQQPLELSRSNLAFSSGTASTEPYKEMLITMNAFKAKHLLAPVIPEYYEYDGYILTQELTTHKVADRVKGPINFDSIESPTLWITIYLKPSTLSPGLYGWEFTDPATDTYTVNP